MKILVDIDGTICESAEGKYDTASPVPQHIEKINKLYEEGNTIIYYTARGRSSGIDYTELTVEQLNDWGCKYHGVIMNHKLAYDLLICDKTKRIEEL
jgi:uncharacterized HAD superfamily protein